MKSLFLEFPFREGKGASDKNAQRFPFILDIELCMYIVPKGYTCTQYLVQFLQLQEWEDHFRGT